ncbi:MAG: hypothetical protein C0506_03765 [Anaerolinea sp.]|nr:hypothetical protein [Anaerolinea sp.]
MTSNRRGFSRERHTELKLLIAGLATCGFGLAWFGFARAHEPVIDSAQVAAALAEEVPTATPSPMKAAVTSTPADPATANPPPPPTAVPAAPTRTPVPAAPIPAQPSPATSVAGAMPKPPSTPVTKKRSRGS